MLRRGINAQPVLNGYCGDYEYGMEKSNAFAKEFSYGWPNDGNVARSASLVYCLVTALLAGCLRLFI